MSLAVEILPVPRAPKRRARRRYRWQFLWNGNLFVSPLRFDTREDAKEDLGRLVLSFRADDFPVRDIP
jgi:hypothetical protein